MDTSRHALPALLEQLGISTTATSADSFLASHRLEPDEALADAPFWTESQAEFLREAFEEDSDWCGVVDELAARLREQ